MKLGIPVFILITLFGFSWYTPWFCIVFYKIHEWIQYCILQEFWKHHKIWPQVALYRNFQSEAEILRVNTKVTLKVRAWKMCAMLTVYCNFFNFVTAIYSYFLYFLHYQDIIKDSSLTLSEKVAKIWQHTKNHMGDLIKVHVNT